jgi:hypothetical protein
MLDRKRERFRIGMFMRIEAPQAESLGISQAFRRSTGAFQAETVVGFDFNGSIQTQAQYARKFVPIGAIALKSTPHDVGLLVTWFSGAAIAPLLSCRSRRIRHVVTREPVPTHASHGANECTHL